MRLPRFRVRTLMLAVGVVALLVWGAMMGTRSYDYYRRARLFGAEERGWRESTARGRWPVEVGSQCADYYAQLSRKYRRAMWRPWMPVAPDPHAPGYDEWTEQKPWRKKSPPFLPHPGFLRPRVSDRDRRSNPCRLVDQFPHSDSTRARSVA
jgi:hypothetical protein